MTRRVRISAAEARRIAMAAQGFDRERPACVPDARHFRRVLNTLGLLQLDFVNVLVPAQLLIIWSRLGAYDRQRFHQFIYDSGDFTEQWAHEASIVPVSAWPLFAHRRASWQPHPRNPVLKLPNVDRYLADVLGIVRREGPLTSNELPPVAGPERKPGDWHRSVPRWALDYHFSQGRLAVCGRMPNFQRIYDLPERVIPAAHLARRLDTDDARRVLLANAASALGVATVQDLADYYRMRPTDAAPRIAELVETGEVIPVQVEGWDKQGYLSAGARIPRRIAGASLLSPFDPLVWFRPRAERLFDFHYRIEIYVPADKRRWGYYVLPFRLADEIVARVDLKADRQTGRLLVQNVHRQEGSETASCVASLATELRALGDWLELEKIVVKPSTGLGRALRRQVAAT